MRLCYPKGSPCLVLKDVLSQLPSRIQFCASFSVVSCYQSKFFMLLPLWFFFITRVLVLCFTLWGILIKIYRLVFEKNLNKHYKMAWNYKIDPYNTTTWRVKSSESKISSYYKASMVSHSLLGDLREKVSRQRSGQKVSFFNQLKTGTVTWEQLVTVFFPLNEL